MSLEHVDEYLDWINLRATCLAGRLRDELIEFDRHIASGDGSALSQLLERDAARDSVCIAAAGYLGWLQGKNAISPEAVADTRQRVLATAGLSTDTLELCRHAQAKARRFLRPERRGRQATIAELFPRWVVVGSPIGLGRIAGVDEAERHVPFVSKQTADVA